MHAQSINEILENAGLKKTQVRLAVLEILEKSSTPIDVQMLIETLDKKKVPTDDVTIYRTVNSFVEAGIITEVHFNDGKTRYEFTTRDHHHHVVCTHCGTVEELDETNDCTVAELEKRIKKQHKFSSISHSLEFFGTCPACIKKIQT